MCSLKDTGPKLVRNLELKCDESFFFAEDKSMYYSPFTLVLEGKKKQSKEKGKKIHTHFTKTQKLVIYLDIYLAFK